MPFWTVSWMCFKTDSMKRKIPKLRGDLVGIGTKKIILNLSYENVDIRIRFVKYPTS